MELENKSSSSRLQEVLVSNSQTTSSFGFKNLKKPVPSSIKFGRFYEIKRPELQLSLFQNIEENRPNFTLTIGSEDRDVSLLTIKRVDFALRELLYIQSYQNGNLEQNTGVAKNGVLLPSSENEEGQSISPEIIDGKEYHVGEIIVKEGDLAKLAFGRDDGSTRKLTRGALKAMQEGITARNAFGDERRRSLIWLRGHDYDSRTNAKLLDIVLHAFYAKDVASNFALHRQGVLNLIGKPTDEKLDLLSLLGIQDKRKPFNIYTITLLEKLSLKEEYKKNKSRAKKKIKDAIDAMLSCKMILQQPDTKKNSKGEIIEYTFYLNPNYTKEE